MNGHLFQTFVLNTRIILQDTLVVQAVREIVNKKL